MNLHSKLTGLALATSVVLCHSISAQAGTQTWNFNSNSQNFSSNNFGNSLSLSSPDGVNLTVTAWSDTRDIAGPDTIQTAKLLWAQSAALGAQNRDENTAAPNHSIDSVTGDADGEYDMLLLEFDTAVDLTGIDLSWAVGGNSSNRTDISLLAFDGVGSPSVNGQTWANVLASNGGDYNSAGNYSNVGLSYYGVNPTNIESSTWLIGVYNPVFGAGGSAGNDGFKLNYFTTSTDDTIPDANIPVPGSLALVFLGLVGLRRRLRRI